LAIALYENGDVKPALGHYDRSIKTLDLAREQESLRPWRAEYTKRLKKILLEDAHVLRQSGNDAAADAAEQRAESLR